MANQKTYTIEIAGVKESYESVSKLADVLDKLTDKTVKVSTEMDKQAEAVEKNTKQVQQSTKATDELGKATQKLQEFDAEYEKEVQRVKSELSAQKKEVSELIKQEQAQAVVDQKQLNSYADKQKYLTSLNKLIRTHANVTDEDKQEIMEMVQESAKLQSELKAFDEEMKIYTRNVGNYPGAAQMVIDANRTMKQELKDITNEMANMLANGVDKTDPKFQALAQRAGELKDAFADAQDEIKHFASDTRGLDNVINLAQTATSVWGLYSNAMQAFGIENKEAEESMKQMMAVMSTLQSLQTLQNTLTAQGSATMKVYETVIGGVTKMLGLNTAATQASTVATNGLSTAQKAGAVASKALSVALRSIPLMFIIGLVVTLITEWESIWNWFRKTFPVLDTLGKKFKQFGGFINTLKATLVGFGQALVNWVTNPIKTLAKVLDRLFALDFAGAYKAVRDGLDQQFRGSAEAFKKGFQQQVEKGLEDISLKALQEGNKQTQQELAELKIRERNNKTYSDKYIALQKKDFEERKKLAKGNQDELNKIKLEEMQFYADVEDKKTAYTKEQDKEREKSAKETAAKRKKTSDEEAKAAAKAAEEYKKKIQELTKAIESNIKEANAINKASLEQSMKLLGEYLDEAYKDYVEQYAAVTTAYRENEEAKKRLEESALKNTENYLIKRKALLVQSLLTDADETKKGYEKIIKETKTLIETAEKEFEKASGKTKVELQEKIQNLKTTLEKTTKEMKIKLGEYAEKPIIIPFDFDADKVSKKFEDWNNMVKAEGKELGFSLTDVFQTLLGTSAKVLNEVSAYASQLQKDLINGIDNTKGEAKDALEEISDSITDMAVVAMLPVESIQEIDNTLDDLAVKVKTMSQADFTKYWMESAEKIRKIFVGANTDFSNLGQIATKTFKDINKMSKNMTNDISAEVIKQSDKVISYNEKIVKKFQEAAKGVKIEPVMVDDKFSKTFDGQIMSIDKTIERYSKLKTAYEEYQNAIRTNMNKNDFEKVWQDILEKTKKEYGENSEEYKKMVALQIEESKKRVQNEDVWINKLETTKKMYGENSIEYKLLLDEKAKNDAAYVLEYEKSQEQIQLIDKKTNSAFADYAESLGKRIQDIYKAFSENMFEPLAEGFTALLDYQIEEAEKRLEDVEELLDKAVELREDSESKIEEINNKLKESDKGNTEALKQQLADEQVLLVQRQQNERDLQKQKEREEAIIKKKEKQQRKIELGQKLIEGIVNTAVGVTAALRYGIPLGPIFAAVIAAMGALQTGIIIKQMSKLEKGGLLKGKSHKQGGMRVEGTNIEVEGGEYVVNKKSTTKYINLIEAINEDNPVKVRRLSNRFENGGVMGKPTTIINNYNHAPLVSSSIRKFADGGQLNYGQSVAAIERNSDAYRVTQAIENMNFEPVVSVVDIQKKTNSLTKVKDLAGK